MSMGGSGKSVEISRLGSQNYATCRINDLPEKISEHSAINTKNGVVSCGGSGLHSNKCYRLDSNGNWNTFYNLVNERSYFSMNEAKNSIVIIGGRGAKRSYEMIDHYNGTKWESKTLPFSIEGHCSTKLDDDSVIITGGYLNGKVN